MLCFIDGHLDGNLHAQEHNVQKKYRNKIALLPTNYCHDNILNPRGYKHKERTAPETATTL